MKKVFSFALVVVAALLTGIVGCEWTSGGDNDDYNTSDGWPDISGNYAPRAGDSILTYQGSPSSPVSFLGFSVEQQGNAIHLTATDGTTYDGNIGQVDQGQDGANQTFRYQFTASGHNALNQKVDMTGTFGASVEATQITGEGTNVIVISTTTSIMQGTWIEEDGDTATFDGINTIYEESTTIE